MAVARSPCTTIWRGNSGTITYRGERQVKFCNQVKFDSSHPVDSSSPQIQFDSGIFLDRPKDGGAMFARYMLELYNKVATQG